jgi:hypothetical protein
VQSFMTDSDRRLMTDELYVLGAEGYSLYIAVARGANARAAERLLGG